MYKENFVCLEITSFNTPPPPIPPPPDSSQHVLLVLNISALQYILALLLFFFLPKQIFDLRFEKNLKVRTLSWLLFFKFLTTCSREKLKGSLHLLSFGVQSLGFRSNPLYYFFTSLLTGRLHILFNYCIT